ncbi:MAG: hypothetical protein EOO09_04000 [Chitinophagaceae bacterium]|nr:MAG: hypothetical protein EOO09_04000 [Chitinophagaceae bacterium]
MPLKIIPLLFCLLICGGAAGQVKSMVVKKKGRLDQVYWADSRIVFQTRDGVWSSGLLAGLGVDSFSFVREALYYTIFGIDTQRFSGYRYAYADIHALPSKREMAVNKGGYVKIIYGHEKFAWLRNGFLFRLAGVTYGGLNITNSLIDGDPPFRRGNLPHLAVAAGSIAIGYYLKSRFYSHRRIGGKYTLETRDY